MKRAVCKVILLTLFCTAGFAQKPNPAEVGGRIVFKSDRIGYQNLFAQDLKTGQEMQLTDFPGALGIVQVHTARWSPDGKKIAFAASSTSPNDSWGLEIYVIDPVGPVVPGMTNIRRITDCPGNEFAYLPEWDPHDSNVLYCLRELNFLTEAYRLDLAATRQDRIPNSSGSGNEAYCVTPDGQSLLFSRKPGYTVYQNMAGTWENIIVPSDGIKRWVCDINPEDEWIVFYEYDWANFSLMKMHKSGFPKVRLAQFPGGGGLWPVWAKGDSNGFVIYETEHLGDREIVLMRADGLASLADIANLTNSPASDERCPDWTPTVWNSSPKANAQDLTRSADASCQALASAEEFNFASSDPDGDDLTFKVVPAGPFPLGETLVTLTVTDSHGASAEAAAQITVVDETKPVPDQASLPTLTGQCSVEIKTKPTASDSCAGRILGKTVDPLSYAAQGTYFVTWIYEDGHGNFESQVQTVIVRDTMNPVIQGLSASPAVLWSPNHKMVPVTVTASAGDNCSGPVVSRIIGVTSNEPDNGLGDGDTAPDWEMTGPLTVNLRAERSSAGEGRIYTILVECKDAAGNVQAGSVQVVVPKSKGR